AIDCRDDLFPCATKDRHHLMDILPKPLGINMRDDFIEDFRGAILDGTNHTEQHTTRPPAPGAIAVPRVPFEGLLASALTPAQRACGQAIALRFAPPACTRKGKAPQERFVRIEQDDLATAGLVLEGSKLKRGVGEIRRGGLQSAGGAVEAHGIFFNTPRT